jgi:hypothetical protein
MKKSIITISILLNIVLISYLFLRENHFRSVYSNSSLSLQGDLVQLEGNIEYQIKNDWENADSVIEKLEDVREGISNLMILGKDLGFLTKSQENDLWSLDRFISSYPIYSGYPNTKLEDNQKEELIQLQEDLKSVGWGMNMGYSSDWKSFSNKVNELIK